MTGTGFIFGWAKPVPVDGRYFKKPITDMAIVAAAGPLSNLIMALAWALIAHLGVLINTPFFTVPLIKMAETGITINLVLFLLNLIPIPPLDGSRVLTAFLSPNLAWKYNRIEPYGFYILIALLYFNIISLLLAYPMYYLQMLFYSIAGLG
jgi:Zn-dependent protease